MNQLPTTLPGYITLGEDLKNMQNEQEAILNENNREMAPREQEFGPEQMPREDTLVPASYNQSEKSNYADESLRLIMQISENINKMNDVIQNFNTCATNCRVKFNDDISVSQRNFEELQNSIRKLQYVADMGKKQVEGLNIQNKLKELVNQYRALQGTFQENQIKGNFLKALGINNDANFNTEQDFYDNLNQILTPNDKSKIAVEPFTQRNLMSPRTVASPRSTLPTRNTFTNPNEEYEEKARRGIEEMLLEENQEPVVINERKIKDAIDVMKNLKSEQLKKGDDVHYTEDVIKNLNNLVSKRSVSSPRIYEVDNKKIKDSIRDFEHSKVDEERYGMPTNETDDAIEVLNNILENSESTYYGMSKQQMRDTLAAFGYEHGDLNNKKEIFAKLNELASEIVSGSKKKNPRSAKTRKSATSPRSSPKGRKSVSPKGRKSVAKKSPATKRKSPATKKASPKSLKKISPSKSRTFLKDAEITVDNVENFHQKLEDLDNSVVKVINNLEKNVPRGRKSPARGRGSRRS